MTAGLTAIQVVLEPVPLGVIDGVEGVRAGEGMQFVPQELHQFTPMQSRMRMRPSRILVLIVPSATLSSLETSR